MEDNNTNDVEVLDMDNLFGEEVSVPINTDGTPIVSQEDDENLFGFDDADDDEITEEQIEEMKKDRSKLGKEPNKKEEEEEENEIEVRNLMRLVGRLEEFAEDPFDGRYYTGYLGLNPIVLIKEDMPRIRTVIETNYDKNKLDFLILNLKEFIDGMRYIVFKQEEEMKNDENLTSEELSALDEPLIEQNKIIAKMKEVVSYLENIRNLKTINLDVSSNGGTNKEISIEDLLSVKEHQKALVGSSLMSLKENSSTFREDRDKLWDKAIKELRNALSAIEASIAFSKDTTVNRNEIISSYITAKYEYTEEEIELLDKLRFPTEYVGKERYEKKIINADKNNESMKTKIALTPIRETIIIKFYNIYLAMCNLRDNKTTISSLFSDK